MRTAILFFVTITCLLGCNDDPKEFFGLYTGNIKTEWLDDGRQMRLLADISFEDPNGLIWKAKTGDVIDGASIPKLLWSFAGSPYGGKYRAASVIHDVACQEKIRTWESVHLAFYYAMRTSGVSTKKAKMMYAGVYHGGPRWPMMREEQVMISAADERIELIPAQYETITEQVMVEAEKSTWKSRQDIAGNEVIVMAEAENTDLDRVLVRTPPVYELQSRQVLVTPASEQIIETPAVYETMQTLVLPPENIWTDADLLKIIAMIDESDSKESSLSLSDIRNYQN